MQVAEKTKFQVLKDETGKATHVVLTVEAFRELLDELEDERMLADILAVDPNEPSIPIEEAIKLIESDEAQP